MVRPAKQKKTDRNGFNTSSKDSVAWTNPQTFSPPPPSVLTTGTDVTEQLLQMEPDNVWLGDPEGDWQRCLDVMKLFGRDGRKLDLWRLWLGCYYSDRPEPSDASVKGKRPENGVENHSPLDIFAADILSRDSVSIASKVHVIAALRQHVSLS